MQTGVTCEFQNNDIGKTNVNGDEPSQVRLGRLLVGPGASASPHHPPPLHRYFSIFSLLDVWEFLYTAIICNHHPSIAFLLLSALLPESPVWLMRSDPSFKSSSPPDQHSFQYFFLTLSDQNHPSEIFKNSGKGGKTRHELFCSGCEAQTITLSQRWETSHWERFYNIQPEVRNSF